MQVSISAYYEWAAKASKITLDPRTVKLESRARALFFESKKSMGSRKLSRHLKQEGFSVGRFKALHLMKQLSLVVQKKKRFVNTTKSHHAFKIAANHLNRQFNPVRPNQVWTTDITYIPSKIGWVYLSVVMDLFSRQVVGWAVNDSDLSPGFKTMTLMRFSINYPSWRSHDEKTLQRRTNYQSH